jgi:RNA polymerase sigma-70 factor (ECF subfamily)
VNPHSPEPSGRGGTTDRAPETMGTAALRIADQQAADDGLEEWVRRAREGDSGAYERVYRSCVGRVHAVCLRMSGSQQEAEELTQDVFVRAWQRLGSFRGESLFTTWLHRLTVNHVLQERRASGRRQSRERSDPDIEAYGHAAVAAMPGTRVDLERAIAALPEGARKVLVLRDVQGYRYQEIARLTGVSLGTVKAQIHRARALIREALER